MKKIEVGLVFDKDDVLEPGTSFKIVLYDLQNPLTLKPTSSFQFELKTSDRLYLIAQETDGYSVTNDKVPPITDAEVIAKNPTLNVPSAYNIEFVPVIMMSFNSIVKIKVPDTLKKDPTPNSFNVSENNELKTQLVASFDENTRIVTIQTGLQREISLSHLSFTVSGFINPNEPSFSQSF